uniref:Trafficking protein particle complex subunit n=1 Tax=Dunaliella tertiolecta TaxID=3047 RepID=A0A6S8MUJ1_DUNTE|mmetsp:Transcript_25269/g.68686  ORF Transcript_25269/g.68686 Transcript_25269/m.68686 type:complete len:137 (-) Transcript_25269:225-635(-)|eukprot:CAMPEP_0202376470 /NCGR_PEP_ID=MMETSP1127-20130417/6954_1 /ASSEMBLY_ACC=CAM_ASM_000462 /TAXON_ID=3047 /ORGANISM="Dunaliella tertiolecta, Strain CCMP1320" /LENGTH=136 /DNA_ID=CAMNT_0048974265 /DNA_START=176 /DNA_END=586 /DNA_ORIENTATION=+
MVSIYTLYVVNKSGGLIYSRDFTSVAKVDLNDALRLASIWHSMHAISRQLSPVPGCTGVELLEADTFTLHCFQTLTGTKFLLVVEPNTPYVPALLRRIYEVYSDYVLKNPFYEVEQVIKCELFDEHLELAVRRHNV